MWSDIVKYAGEYESAVLTGMETGGYPFSQRCRPEPDAARKRLYLDLPRWIPLEPGPACLLWHRHDAHLWNLHSFVVRGTLIHEETGWYLQPAQFIPGVGIGGWRSYVHFLLDGRRTTRRYLQRRGLSRPKLNWHEWEDLTSHP
jgi:hypothetical protein